MSSIFGRNFFGFLIGFILILIASFVVLYFTGQHTLDL